MKFIDLLATVIVVNCILFMKYFTGKFPIITFEEFIAIALDASRVVGIYPEIKNPVLINQHVSNFLL